MNHSRYNYLKHITNKDELLDTWDNVGGNNVVFRTGELAVKACLSLLNENLGSTSGRVNLVETSMQIVR
jgi:hypothetical protein